MKKLMIILSVVLTIALGGVPVAQALELPGCRVTDHGRGVYYLTCAEVGPALSKLRELHPEANITATSSTFAIGGFGLGTTGYYVIVNPPPTK